MSKERETVTLPLDELLRESRRQATSMSLPLAVHHRLDTLVEQAAATYATRAEIIGLLISEADLGSAELEHRVMAYRKKTVGDVVPAKTHEAPETQNGNVITLGVRQPGRPRTRRASA